MTYRVGHHSTSDDSTRYRAANEVEYWKKRDNPLTRLRLYMEERSWWNEEQEREYQSASLKRVMTALKAAESQKKPPLTDLFSDVYDQLPKNLIRQQEEMFNHLKKYPQDYAVGDFSV